MKFTYVVRRDGKDITEVNSLKEAEKVTKEFSKRRTGKTTRLLLRALGSESEKIIIIGANNNHARQLAKRLTSMLDRLSIEYKSEGVLEVTIYDKNIKVLPEDYYTEKFLHENCEVFRDEF